MEKIDETCQVGLRSLFTNFKDHSSPVVETPEILTFTERAPAIFGDTWNLRCDLRGVKPYQKEEKEHNILRIHSVFYEILAMTRIANRKELKHWALIQSVSNFAWGCW